jgi:hypothetical protein
MWLKLKPLGGFILAMLAFWIAKIIFESFIFERAAWTDFLENSS